MTSTAAPGPSSDDLSALAAQYNLRPLGLRPTLRRYVRDLWDRRGFIWSLSASKASSRHQNTYLGQFWLVLNPILLAAVYFVVFGLLLGTDGGVENYIGFLVIGIFIYTFIANTMAAAGTSITGNVALIRALQFPRASLPLAVVIAEALVLVPALGVMIVLTVISGERPAWTWLLLPVAFLVTLVFNAGVALIAARAVQVTRDLKNVIPLVTRVLRYVSGVFFSVQHYAGDSAIGALFEYQPVAVYLTMFRSCMLAEFEPDLGVWLFGVAWAVALLVAGILLFWQAEDQYGRD